MSVFSNFAAIFLQTLFLIKNLLYEKNLYTYFNICFGTEC